MLDDDVHVSSYLNRCHNVVVILHLLLLESTFPADPINHTTVKAINHYLLFTLFFEQKVITTLIQRFW